MEFTKFCKSWSLPPILKGLNWITTENTDNPIVELNLIKNP